MNDQDKKYLKLIRAVVENFIKSCSDRFDEEGKLLLDIAPQIYEGARKYFKKANVVTLDIDSHYNPDYVADICSCKQISGGSFDFVLCTEVLEHVLRPFEAIDEIHRMLKKNGYLFLSVPLNFRIHGPLPDCWRFTEHGLRELLKDFNLVDLSEIPTPDRKLMPINYQVTAQK